MQDTRFWGLPMCLETPKSADLHEDIEALALLRGWLTPARSLVQYEPWKRL
jgi:hypothetical protein